MVVSDARETLQRIYQYIPHRPPFLWVDAIIDLNDHAVEAEKYIPENLSLLAGHYPGYPILPGVLLCEAVFQTGAILIGEHISREHPGDTEVPQPCLPVLTRIYKAKFKQQVLPGTTIRMMVEVKEIVGRAWVLVGKVVAKGKVALQVEFSCMLTEQQSFTGKV
jgi:3-hydroxyacyl-[acyl-carrier-protein] dehydratase